MQVQMQGVPLLGKGDPSFSSQQIGSGQVYWSPRTNPSSGMQSTHCHILLQQKQAGTEAGMRDPPSAHRHKPKQQQQQTGTEAGMRDPQSAQWHKPMQQQQAGTETGIWDTLHGSEQAQIACGGLLQELLFAGMGYPACPSSSAQTSVPSLVKSEVMTPFGASDYMWGLLAGNEMPFSGDEQPSSSARTSVSSLVKSEVMTPFGASDYMWGLLAGHEMPFSGDEQPSSSAQTSVPSLVKSEVMTPLGASDYMWGPLAGHEIPFSGDEQLSSSWQGRLKERPGQVKIEYSTYQVVSR